MSRILHVVGCGRAGRTLARLWAEQGVFRIGWIVNRSVESAAAAAGFIGQGRPATGPGPVADGDWLMLALPDSALAPAAEQLSDLLAARPALAFHVSGSEPAAVLRPLGERIASVHPVCPFGDPDRALSRFAGSFAVGDGDGRALDELLPCFEAIGAQVIRFAPTDKRLYHAATIAASNFLNVLDDLALDLAEQGGMDRETALKVVVALQRAALAGIEASGPAASLTGPIERGDEAVCRRLAAMFDSQTSVRDQVFRALARGAVDLAHRKHDGKHGRPPAYGSSPLQELFDEPGFVRGTGGDGGV
ncbi:MAG: Rossmann-like and DUF2520 domain-containing protein [Wenzhouxiangellaceae bacterium]|nr:Rossmann-like and DUF2520 domain-containing protein [Wenzhouxiangellaceae bacterium]